jgi:hypothetical protein
MIGATRVVTLLTNSPIVGITKERLMLNVPDVVIFNMYLL